MLHGQSGGTSNSKLSKEISIECKLGEFINVVKIGEEYAICIKGLAGWTPLQHYKANAPIYTYYTTPETPLMSSVIADCLHPVLQIVRKVYASGSSDLCWLLCVILLLLFEHLFLLPCEIDFQKLFFN